MSELPRVIIYSDGACDPNPGPGGWAAILKFRDKEKILKGSVSHSTNNRMELTAAIRALQTLKTPCQVEIITDSQYLKLGITKWLPSWRARNWRRKGGKLANVDLWQELEKAIQPHEISWRWIRGHAGDPLNQRVDLLARQAIHQGDTQ